MIKSELTNQIKLDDEAVGAITLCAKQQQVISDDVLDISRLEASRVSLNIAPMNLKEVMGQAVRMFAAETASKSIEIYTKFPFEDLRVKGDSTRLLQILGNLLANSIKFTQRSTTKQIHIALEILEKNKDKVDVRISIRDTGIGMTEDEMKQIFDRFLHGSPNHQHGFSGLGLYICKGLVQLMGGEISVQSDKWAGSTFLFTLTFPLVPSDPIPTIPIKPVANASAASLSSVSLMIVEDNLVNQKVLTRHLQAIGVKSMIASNGLEAVQFSEKNNFDLIFMDVEMPVMDGLEATRQIRLREKTNHVTNPVPIVGLSGNARQEHIDMARSVGMDDYIVKPYTKESIYTMVHKYATHSK
eukprot:TRINITY_DN5480_c0_g1_i2.p1 TRINITY_DN5480_c0_g1~~TRINITY_DN5480_c0_g1_i2.p1  ORF type:complete len:357 (+),score=86.96 TRINITY_DN5480_c0_g1_i2:359-1429(+)